MKLKTIAMFAAALAAAAAGTPLRAQNTACKADGQNLCGSMKDEASAAECMRANLSKIQDPGCKALVTDYQTKYQKKQSMDSAIKAACAADIKKDPSCSGDIGSGLLDCLQKDPGSLSDSCKNYFRPAPPKVNAAKQTAIEKACASDLSKAKCSGDFGTELACLKNDPASLSDTCKDSFRKSPTARIQKKNAAIVAACSSDVKRLSCSGMDITSGLVKCLKKDSKHLVAGCRTALQGQKGGSSGK